MDVNEAWSLFQCSAIHLRLHKDENLTGTILAALAENDMLISVEEFVLEILEKTIQKDLVPLLESDDQTTLFPNLVSRIYEHAQMMHLDLKLLDEMLKLYNSRSKLSQSCTRMYHICLEMPYYKKIFALAHNFYDQAYNVYCNLKTDQEEFIDDDCSRCQDDIQRIREALLHLDIFHDIVSKTLLSVAQNKITEYVSQKCSESFQQHHLSDLEDWLMNSLYTWLSNVSIRSDTWPASSIERLQFYLYESFVKLRLNELLQMIIDYPDSKPGFEDLHECLPKTGLRKDLVNCVKQVFETRILHPGVTTTDILTAYIHSIQALRVLDPSCVILEIVTEPVKQYLRAREDTVRCIVSNLIDDSCDILSDELTKATTDQDIIDDDNIGDGWEQWQPDPVDANPAISSKVRRSTDIINMLVNIYGTKELFIKEYWNLLADRILLNLSYSTLWEIKYFELLKIRFGDSDLHKCEVMLKDVTDSKRINSWVNDEMLKDPSSQLPFQLNAMILSAEYWPSIREEKIELPADMKSALEKYTKLYEVFKANRTLKWQAHLGLVDIDVELDSGKILAFKTSPINVAVIMAFQEQGVFNVEELGNKLQMCSSVVRRSASYWQTKGLLYEESTDKFRLNRDHSSGPPIDHVDEDEIESAIASVEQQKEEEMQMLWTYVNGMLTNMDSQPLSRIHSLLKMFANTDCTINELEKFLARKVREGKLTCNGGVYRLATS